MTPNQDRRETAATPTGMDPLTLDTPEQVRLTEQSQDAVFRIGLGWTGGMGGYPVLEEGTNAVKCYRAAPIFLDDGQAEKILKQANMPASIRSPIIKISARVRDLAQLR